MADCILYDPKKDYISKSILGREKNKNLLITLLNSIQMIKVIILFLFIFSDCQSPKIHNNNNKDNKGNEDNNVIYRKFPFPEKVLKNKNMLSRDYREFIKKIENFYNAKNDDLKELPTQTLREKINKDLKKNPISIFKKYYPEPNGNITDAIYQSAFLGSMHDVNDKNDKTTINVLKNLPKDEKKKILDYLYSTNKDSKYGLPESYAEFLFPDKFEKFCKLNNNLFSEIKKIEVPFSSVSTNLLEIIKNIKVYKDKNKKEFEKFPDGIYLVSFCPFCAKPIHRYSHGYLNFKYKQFISVMGYLFDYEMLGLKCYNKDCVNINKIGILNAHVALIVKGIEINIKGECDDKSFDLLNCDSKNDVKIINLVKIIKGNATTVFKFYGNGCNIIVKKISKT